MNLTIRKRTALEKEKKKEKNHVCGQGKEYAPRDGLGRQPRLRVLQVSPNGLVHLPAERSGNQCGDLLAFIALNLSTNIIGKFVDCVAQYLKSVLG